MKPYNIYGCGINKWVDLDSVLEIEDSDLVLEYRLAFQDRSVRILIGFDCRHKFYNDVYLPFLNAWKNKDIINVSK